MSDPQQAHPDPRPAETPPRPARPQYGEYASAEEQRARTGLPDIVPSLDTGAAVPAAPAPVPHAAPAVADAPRPRTVDRIITFSLLAYGLFNVLTSIPSFLDYSLYADTMFDLLGIDATLTDPAAGRPWGIAAVIVLAIGWLLTATLSWWSMRRGRLSWWIPLVGGIVFTTAAGILMTVPLMNDPAVWEAMLGSVG